MSNQTNTEKFSVVKTILLIIAIFGALAFGYAIFSNINSLKLQIKENKVKLDEKDSESKKLKNSRDRINEELEKLKKDHSSSQEKIKELEVQKQELEKKLQAKLEQKERLARAAQTQQAQAAAKPQPVASKPVQQPQAVQVSYPAFPTYSQCVEWMKQAGVTDIPNANFIFQKESNCRPHAVNPSSKAHGVCQSLPGNKMASAGADWYTNPVTQMRWCQSYAISRYGSWEKAVAFWRANRWW